MPRRPPPLVAAVLLLSAAVAFAAPAAGAGTRVGPVLTPVAPTIAAGTGRDFWPVPAAAWTRPLGVIPTNPASINRSRNDAPYAAGRGIPLGGLGAGSFMYNQAGSFGPWELRNGLHEERILAPAAFHVREQPAGRPATVRTLATHHPLGDVLPAWNRLAPGDGSYSALYPFGWTSYKPFASDVSIRFFSPIVAREEQRSSLPVAYFTVRLANHTAAYDDLSVMLTFPNAPLSVTDARDHTRTGLYSQANSDPATGVTAVTLGASSAANAPDAQDTEWTIGARPVAGQTASYLTSWNGAGTGSDVQGRFASGALGNTAADASHSAGALALSTRLAPGKVTTMSFALAWDFPRVLFGPADGQHSLWMKRYTSFFGGRETPTNDYVAGSYQGRQGFAIANRALAGQAAANTAVHGWWDKVAYSAAYPLWLRQAALNELYYNVFGSSFWESGLVENTYPYASIPQFGTPSNNRVGSQFPGTHLYANIEGRYPNMESYDVRAYMSRQWLTLFPTIERDVQRAWTEMVLQDSYGHAPHDAGRNIAGTTGAPYVVWPGYDPKQENWLDLPAKYLVQAWEYYRATGDEEFFRYAYPALRRSYDYLAGRIPAGEHLPVDDGVDSTYDGWPMHGTTSYVGGLWILAQEVMAAANDRAVALALPAADPALSVAIAAELPQSRAEYESRLYDPAKGWYRISTGDAEYGGGVMADATFAQEIAERDGLPDVVGDVAHLRSHLLTSYAALVAAWRDPAGGGMGAANGVRPDGGLITTGGTQAREVWTGVSYTYAAAQYLVGVRLADPTLQANGLDTARGVAHQTYDVTANGYTFDTPEAWQVASVTNHRALQYQRPRAVWELLLAMRDPFAP